MIWYTCKQCGKTHGRPENSAGTMVFCECGTGNIVPWESTVAEPVQPVVPVAEVPGVPELAPLTFEPTTSKGGSSYPAGGAPAAEPPRRRSRGERKDPAFCFNHQHVARAAACDDCGESFCAECLVKFQGVSLCAACKNFRARSLETPPSNTTLASASVVISLMTGMPLAFCMSPFINQSGVSVLSLLALAPQLLALALAVRALYLSEKESKYTSQAMAITGIATASLTCLLTVLLNVYASRIAV